MSERIEVKQDAASARIAELEALVATQVMRIADLEKERDRLRASHQRLREELELLKRRIFVAKAERVDTAQLEMEFAEKLRELEAAAARHPRTCVRSALATPRMVRHPRTCVRSALGMTPPDS